MPLIQPADIVSSMSGPLYLVPGVQMHLHYGTGVRRDLQLLDRAYWQSCKPMGEQHGAERLSNNRLPLSMA